MNDTLGITLKHILTTHTNLNRKYTHINISDFNLRDFNISDDHINSYSKSRSFKELRAQKTTT